DSLVHEVRVIDDALRDDVGAAAVLVHARADVVIAGSNIRDRAVGAALDQRVPSAFVRPSLEPVDVVAVERDEAEPQPLRGDGLCGDGRCPGAVGCDCWHGLRTPVYGLQCQKIPETEDRSPTSALLGRLARPLLLRDLCARLTRFRETDG